MAQTKIQYTKNENDAIRLFQYIFSVENSGRFALFNFHNQYTQSVKCFSFVVVQYDKNNEVITKNKMEYDDFYAKENTFFVPKIKLSLDDECIHLDVYVVEAFFEKDYYFDGKISVAPVEEIEEKFDVSTLHFFHNKRLLSIRKNSLVFFLMLLFIGFSLLVLYLYIANKMA